jgi:hypothetical protein
LRRDDAPAGIATLDGPEELARWLGDLAHHRERGFPSMET